MTSACIDGHFGHCNLGDEELRTSFLQEHRATFNDVITISGVSENCDDDSFRVAPYYYQGWRYARGLIAQWKFWHSLPQEGSARRILVWMGGLLGESSHIEIRSQSLAWALRYKWLPSYWFGDVELKAAESSALLNITNAWNQSDSWIAVRSNEAAQILKDAGLQRRIRVGIDPVLYRIWNHDRQLLNSNNQRNRLAVIIPCQGNMKRMESIVFWSQITKRIRDRGMETRWGIFDSQWDRELVKEISRACGDSGKQLASETLSHENTLSEISKSSLCFSGRYHGAIFPLALNVPHYFACLELQDMQTIFSAWY